MASSSKYSPIQDRNISLSFTFKVGAVSTDYNNDYYWIFCRVIAGPNVVLVTKSPVYIAIRNLTSYVPALQFTYNHDAYGPIEQM